MAKSAKRKKKKDERSFSEKWSERASDAKHLSSTLVRSPKEFPDAAHGVIRRGLRRMWSVHGGGLYSLGFVITFLLLEIRMLIDDLVGMGGFGEFFSEQLLQFVFRFASESIVNTVQAFIWPVYLIQYNPPWGIIALGIAFSVFPHTLEVPIEKWLFGEEIPNTGATRPSDADESQPK